MKTITLEVSSVTLNILNVEKEGQEGKMKTCCSEKKTLYSWGGSGTICQGLKLCQLMWMSVVKSKAKFRHSCTYDVCVSIWHNIWMYKRPFLFFLKLFHIVWWSDFDAEQQFELWCKHGRCLKMSECDDRTGLLCLCASSVEVKLMVKGDHYWTWKCAIV